MQLLTTLIATRPGARQSQTFHGAGAGHRQPSYERAQCLFVFPDSSSGRLRRTRPQGPEHGVFLQQNRFHDFARYVREAEVAALEPVGQALVIDSQTVQDSGLEIVYMHGILCDVVAVIVGLAVG